MGHPQVSHDEHPVDGVMMGAGALQPSKVCQPFCSAMAGNVLLKHPPFVSAFLNKISFLKKLDAGI
jgi:hypothetical protein